MVVAFSSGLVVKAGVISGEVVSATDRAATQTYEHPYPTIVRPPRDPNIRLVSKLDVEQSCRVSRAEARAFTWRSIAFIGFAGWLIAIVLGVYVFAPSVFPWIAAHGYFMSLFGVAAVLIVYAYRAADVWREWRATGRIPWRVLEIRRKSVQS